MKSIITLSLLSLLSLTSCSSQAGSKGATVKIDDKKYRVATIETGKMSWYSVKTNFGTATASGEKFRNHGHTAAHKKLKMGTRVRVTNLENGKSKIVRINDRGPYKPGRIIDVSVGMSHGDHLDFHHDGVVKCKVEVLEPVEAKS
jgi:rare lipoprotein A